ncbi:MAG: hypothetical protein KF760_14350 [Candidatus Eremiobacteraeota bacterium]|nr:hypothetical protein [Candidatus Eremiobacteraeota bacterium]MCW5868267.1 hypothetical protein [Candidatus Eremiobacteraeota bacterium]
MKLPWKVHSRKRGAGILTVLTASSLLLLLGLTVAGTSFHHLSVSNRLHHSQVARNLAEDCLAKGLAKVLAHTPPDDSSPFPGVLTVSNGDPQVESGVLTFDQTLLPSLNAKLKNTQMVQSINNIGGESSLHIDGTDITIPEHSIYLRAVGVDHGIERCMEAVVWVPPFPYAMAAGGKISISGDSKVASVKDMADLGDPSQYLPGSLATNSAEDEALKLDGTDILVTGDVQAAGGAHIATGTVIKGETRLHAGQVHIPTINIGSYNTSSKPGVTTFTSNSGPNQVDGYAYRSGPLDFNSGVTLNGGIVYVDGDLTVNGPISGEGALIATGKLTITGTGQLNSNNKVALLSQQDMTLTGTSGSHLGASGLLYTEGKLKADYADISGSAAAPIKDVEFTNVNMIQDRTQKEIKITTAGAHDLAEFPPAKFLPGQSIVIPGFNFDMTSLGFQSKIVAPPSRFQDPTTQEYHLKVNYQTTDSTGKTKAREITNPGPPPIYAKLPPGLYESFKDANGNVYQGPPTSPSSVSPLGLADLEITLHGTTYSGTDTTPFTLVRQEVIAALETQKGSPLSSSELAQVDLQLVGFGLSPTALIDSFMTLGNVNMNNLAMIAMDMDGVNETSTLPPGETVTFTLNPGLSNSNFINLADRLRLLYWREVTQ